MLAPLRRHSQEASGNFILLGVLNFVRVPQLPVTAIQDLRLRPLTAGVGQFTKASACSRPINDRASQRRSEVRRCKTRTIPQRTSRARSSRVHRARVYFVEVLEG